MPIHPNFWHIFGIQRREKYYFEVHQTFSCKSSPKIFNTLSEVLCWILSNNYAIPFLVHLLEDFISISPSTCSPCSTSPYDFKRFFFFSELGVPISEGKKKLGPMHKIEFLGVYLDSLSNFKHLFPKRKSKG